MIAALLLTAALAAPTAGTAAPAAAPAPGPVRGATPTPTPTPTPTAGPSSTAPGPPAAAVRPFNGDKPGQLNADEVRFNLRTRQVTVVGKPYVTLIHDDATLTCRRLTGENDATGKLKVAVCEGEVKLVRAGRVVTCDRATYDRLAGRVVCTGHPLFRDPGGTEARATSLTYDLTNDEILLEQGQVTVPGAELDAGMPSLKGSGAAPKVGAPPEAAKPDAPPRPGSTP